MVYVGALAYAMTSCTSYNFPIRPQKTSQLQEKNGLEAGFRYEGCTNEWVSFSVVLSNYSDTPVEIKPSKFYIEDKSAAPAPQKPLHALNPEQKIKEYQQRIIKRQEANEAGKTVLIVLGVLLIIGLIAVAISEDVKEAKEEKSSNANQAPRNSNSYGTYQNVSQPRNNCYGFRQSNLGVTLNAIADITVSIASIQRCERGYTSMSGMQKLQFMQNFWENEALLNVMLQPNERVQGLIFFPRKTFKTHDFQVVLPITDTPHTFSYKFH